MQRDQIRGVNSAQTYDHPLRSRIEDEDPIFLMIYYDNDQFCGEEIYYLCVQKVLKNKNVKRRSINKLHHINQQPMREPKKSPKVDALERFRFDS